MILRILKWTLIGLACLVGLVVTAGIGLWIATAGEYTVPPTADEDLSVPTLDIEGYRFHGETFGNPDNPVVVVLHGGPGNDYRMLLPLRALSDDYLVVFYDQRGSGLSPRVPPEQLTMEQYLADLDAIVDRYTHGRGVLLLGHSFGAMLASAYMGQHPEKVDGAVLAEPGFLTTEMAKQLMDRTNGMKPSHLHFYEFRALVKLGFQMLHVQKIDGHEPMDWFYSRMTGMNIQGHPLKGYYCGGNMSSAHMPEWRIGSSVSMTMMGSIVDEEGNIEADFFSDGVECYENEVLFVASACNKLIGEEVQREHMKLFQNAALAVIPYAGHTMFGEEPERSMKVLRDYLSRVAVR